MAVPFRIQDGEEPKAHVAVPPNLPMVKPIVAEGPKGMRTLYSKMDYHHGSTVIIAHQGELLYLSKAAWGQDKPIVREIALTCEQMKAFCEVFKGDEE